MGNPSMSETMTKRTAEFGTLKNGKIWVAIWRATTRPYRKAWRPDTHCAASARRRTALDSSSPLIVDVALQRKDERWCCARVSDITRRSCARLLDAVSARIGLHTAWRPGTGDCQTLKVRRDR